MKIFSTFSFLFLISLFSFLSKPVIAQDCCGLGYITGALLQSGINGGYGIQMYSAEGLNHYIDVYNENHSGTLNQRMDEFGQVQGFKIGANIAQFMVDNYLVGLKLYYSWMNEKNSAKANVPGGIATREYDLQLGQFGIGLGFAYYVSKHLDIKILDAYLTFNSAKLTNRYIEPGQPTDEQVLKNPETSIGANLGTGLTFYIFPPYLAIELSGGYAIFSIGEMEFENGTRLATSENNATPMDNFIDGGGIYGFAQLNIAIPLN